MGLEKQVHLVVKTLFLDDAITIQDGNGPIRTAKMIQERSDRHEIKRLYGLFNCQFAFMQIQGISSYIYSETPFLPLTVDPEDQI